MDTNGRDGEDWVDFRYDRFCKLCYFCGKVRHAEDQCIKSKGGNFRSLELGPWLKASQLGRRVEPDENINRDRRRRCRAKKKIN